MIPGERIKALKKYFEGRSPWISVQADWDSDLLAWAFRFDGGPGMRRSLRISAAVIDDTPVPRVIAGLEKAHWEEVLKRPGSPGVIFTSKGLQPLDS